MNRTGATFLISEARDISRQLGTARRSTRRPTCSIAPKRSRTASPISRRSRDRKTLDAQIAVLCVPSPVAGEPRAKTPYDVLESKGWEIGAPR